MSSVASASEGMTFAPTPALSNVGTTDVRSIEYLARRVFAQEFLGAGSGVRIQKRAVDRRAVRRADAGELSK